MRPRRLPRLPKANNRGGQPLQNPPINNEQKGTQIDESQIRNIDSDYIRKKNKIRERHREDFAITIATNREDLISEDAKLFDNKDINLEAPKIKENIDLENTEFYIENIHNN